MKTSMMVRQPDGFLQPVRQSLHGQIDRGRVMPMLLGYEPQAPSWPGLLSQPRVPTEGYRPGVMDPRVNSRHEMRAMPSGTSSTDTDAHAHLAASVKRSGPNGSRLSVRGDFLMACPGVLSRMPIEKSPAAAVLESQRAATGDGFRYGSPVTAFSAAAAHQMRHGGRIPETGQLEVRRHTTTTRSFDSVITPGEKGKTAGYTNVRNGVPTLPGTPMLSGVESVVQGTPFPGTAPLAVGTEAFAYAADYGGPYQIAPTAAPNAAGPAPSGRLLSSGDMRQMHPSWQGGYAKPGARASVETVGAATSSADAPPQAPKGRGLLVGLLVVGAMLMIGRK